MLGNSQREPFEMGTISLSDLNLFDEAIMAIKKGDNSQLDKILKSKSVAVLVQFRDVSTKTLLHFAVENSNALLVGKLLDLGSDPFVQDKWGRTPLHYAASLKQDGVLSMICQVPGRNFLKRIGELRRIKDYEGLIALHHAARSGTVTSVHSLLQNVPEGDDDALEQLDIEDSIGSIALHYAAESSNIDVVIALAKAGANTNYQNSLGNTPLHRASRKGHHKCIQVLIDLNADPSIKNHKNQTAQDLGRNSKNAEK